jgi:phosphorylcholine metabolism protein LicD
LLASVICKKLPIDNKYSLRGQTLIDALEKDRKDGFIPFYVNF